MINKEIEANLAAVLDSYSLALAERDLLYVELQVVGDHIKKLEDVKSRLEQATAVLEGVDAKVIDGARATEVGNVLSP